MFSLSKTTHDDENTAATATVKARATATMTRKRRTATTTNNKNKSKKKTSTTIYILSPSHLIFEMALVDWGHPQVAPCSTSCRPTSPSRRASCSCMSPSRPECSGRAWCPEPECWPELPLRKIQVKITERLLHATAHVSKYDVH